jgi:hypothetical protein
MFGRSKDVLFEPYGRRRSRWSVPRWLVLLVVGIAVGAGGVIYIQERYLPPRLSADASARLRASFDEADKERLRLKNQLADSTKQLAGAVADKKSLTEELGASRATVTKLQDDVASLIAALPPDPRGGDIEVRAARFEVKNGALAYDVVLSRERAQGQPLSAVMQLVVEGETAQGTGATVNLEPVSISMGGHASLRGSLRLPDGFRPRQTTIQLLDRAGGRSLGRRVMYVK